MSRRGTGRVAAIFCCSSYAESCACAHRTLVYRLIGMKIPFVAPAPCFTLDHAVLSRSSKLQQGGVIITLSRAAHVLINGNGRP